MNQMQPPVSEQNETISPSVVTGQRLREAREGLGLSRDDVARELRLQEKLIGALEEGDRSQLPPAAFINGYLRAYARLLGLPAEQLIADYLAERVAPSLYRATDRTGMPITSSRDPRFRFTTYAVIAVTALLFAAWWANQRFSFVSLEPAQTETSSGTQHEIEATLPEPMPLYQEPHPEEVESAPVPPEGGKASSTPHAAVPSTATPPVAQPKVTVVTPPAAASVSAPQAEPAKPVQPLPVVSAEPLSPSVPQSTLAMEFQAACWTQVEDATGRVLVYGTINPGRKLQLHGVAPFKVFLGYAPGVLVYYNGTLFSHAAYQRGELARFSVGSSQDNRPLGR